jgi:type VI secretion system protein ImpH
MQALLERAPSFSFFQAVRLLQGLFPGSPMVGRQGPVEKERIRFKPTLDFSFAPSDIAAIRETELEDGSTGVEVMTTFLSLYGTASPLPSFFTERLFDQDEDSLQRGFLDLFHHRILALFYRTWEKYRFSAQFEDKGDDFYSLRLLDLLALDPSRFPPDHHVSRQRFVGFAGLLTQVPHSAVSLGAALSDYFSGIPVTVESFLGRWVEIPPVSLNRLGQQNSALGSTLTLGDRVFDFGCTFEVRMGPMGLADYMSLLPGSNRQLELREIVDVMNGDCLDYQVGLKLKEDEVPPLQLSAETARLGWSTWLGRTETMDTDVRFLMKGWLHGRG